MLKSSYKVMPKIRIYLEKKIVKDHKILLDSKQLHYLKKCYEKENWRQYNCI